MAFKTIGQEKTEGDALYTTKLEIGASYTGYPVERRVKEDDKRKANLVMVLENGERRLIFTSGNVAYAAAEDKLELNVLTRITRLPDGTVTNKTSGKTMKSTKFQIEQDTENVWDASSATVVEEGIPDLGNGPIPPQAERKGVQASLEASLAQGSVAQRAAEMAKAAQARRK